MLVNCHIWTVVDFGNGPVEIRCTEVGEHDQHRCEVFIDVDDVGPQEQDPNRRNIFDRQAG